MMALNIISVMFNLKRDYTKTKEVLLLENYCCFSKSKRLLIIL